MKKIDVRIMSYIPKEYKKLVVAAWEEEKEYDEDRHRWDVPISIEWENGEIDTFTNKAWMKYVLKEVHSPEEFK